MYIAIVIGIISAILLGGYYLIKRGQPRGIRISISGYTDTFERTDYEKNGKVAAPYKYWNKGADTLAKSGQNCDKTACAVGPEALIMCRC